MRRPSRRSSMIPVIAALAAAAAGCGNPVLDARIEALGGEAEGIEPGEYHRPGQPCVLCHGKYGGAEPEMSVGGTIFALRIEGDNEKPIPVEDITVLLVDADGSSPPAIKTNCIGNFYVTVEDWNPSFPLYAELNYEGPDPMNPRRVVMNTWIQRDGSCATCHTGAPNQGSPGWIYCARQQPTPPLKTLVKGACEGAP